MSRIATRAVIAAYQRACLPLMKILALSTTETELITMSDTIQQGVPLAPEPLRFAYLYQPGTGMISRLRVWNEWLSKSGTRDVEGELIAMDGDASVLACATECEWQVLIYEPPGWSFPEAKS
ncbi:MAG: hypothetical protein IV088_01935 [Hydrogenophaga sp.]|uniref:hypothetical protein n=1 Tax=Hydrogenophaga sp. TaxID=1904254 RepID=UPI0025BFD407|nr:hypothetical protein [Hydrogenophaga sp.]MBT9549583.1 hypothetical protein [Hydrogenophaga sp.]